MARGESERPFTRCLPLTGRLLRKRRIFSRLQLHLDTAHWNTGDASPFTVVQISFKSLSVTYLLLQLYYHHLQTNSMQDLPDTQTQTSNSHHIFPPLKLEYLFSSQAQSKLAWRYSSSFKDTIKSYSCLNSNQYPSLSQESIFFFFFMNTNCSI